MKRDEEVGEERHSTRSSKLGGTFYRPSGAKYKQSRYVEHREIH